MKGVTMKFNFISKKSYLANIIIVIFIAVLGATNTIWAQNIFIDPNANQGGDGSFLSPYNSWNDVIFSSSNDYYQKAGTTDFVTESIFVNVSGKDSNKIVIGPYYNKGGTPVFGIPNADAKPRIIREPGREGAVLNISSDHVHINNLELRGGSASILIRGADCIVEYCIIGENAKFGIRVEGENAVNTTIRFNIIDSKTPPSPKSSSDGISLVNGSSHTHIYKNVFASWGHNVLQFINSSYNEIYGNTAINPNKINMRFFGIAFGSDYNKIHNNWVEAMDVRSQIGEGVYNEIYKNIFYTMTDTSKEEGACIWFQGIGGGESRYNKVYNNIIYNVQREGIRFYNNPADGILQNNKVYKNIIFNNGTGFATIRIANSSNGVLNQTIKDNFIYNDNGDDIINHRGKVYSTSEFNQNSTYDIVSNNKWLDPKFKDAENGNLSFEDDSPCLQQGIEQVNVQALSESELLSAGVGVVGVSNLLPPLLRIANQ